MENGLTAGVSLSRSIPSVLLIICLVGLPQISETIYSPALPAITVGLKTTSHLVQWSLSIYFIGFAIGVAFWGKLSDHIGRRPVMLIGLFLYLLFSLMCESSNHISYLLIARFFQAFGVSVGSVITQAVMRDCFNGIERNKIFSVAGMAIASAPALGPFMGGYLTEYISWRANFGFLTLLGSILFIYAYIRLPETYTPLTLITLEKKPLTLPTLLLRMLRDKHVLASSLLIGGFNGILFGYYSEAPYLFIDLYHLSAKHFGMLGVIMAMGVCLGSFFSHRLNHLINTLKLIKIACFSNLLIMLIFFALVYLHVINSVDRELSIGLIMLCMMLFYICFGVGIPNILSKALVNYHANIGAAGSILGLIYYILVAVFIFGIGVSLPNSLYIMPVYFLVISALMAFSTFYLKI